MNNFNASNKTSPQGQAYTPICLSCGHKNAANSVFCDTCGKPLNTAAAPNTPPQSMPYAPNYAFFGMPDFVYGLPLADWASYVGTSWQAYVLRFAKMEARNSKISISLSAFFLGPFFFAYRKMLLPAVAAMLLFLLDFVPAMLIILAEVGSPLLAGFDLELLGRVVDIMSFVVLAARIVMALFASYWYKEKILRDVGQIKKQAVAGQDYAAQLRQKGDTSVIGVLIIVGIVFLASYVMSAFFGKEVLAYYDIVLATSRVFLKNL